MGYRLYNGDGGSSLYRSSIHLNIAISIVISTFTLPCYVSVKC
nr:MAG TPA: hypothetical protein [Bacteriophage sp.]